MKIVKKITEIDNLLYDDYVKSISNTLLFQSFKYIQSLTNLLNCNNETLICFDITSKEITGVLPLLALSGKFGKVYNSLPFFGSNGGIIAADAESKEALFNEFISIAKQADTASIMISENPLLLSNLHSTNFDFVEERLCQISPIHFENNHAEMLMNQFHFKTRNMIRKSFKLGIEVSIDNTAIDFLYNTHIENMLAVEAKSKPHLFFENIASFFEKNKDYKIYVAKYNGEIVAALLLFFYKDIAEYYTPVIKQEYRALQPNSCLIYQAMIDASEKGFKLWNWGGTGKNLDTLYRFKSRWGAKDYFYKYYGIINNKEILKSSPEELSQEYPFFYSVPFNLFENKTYI